MSEVNISVGTVEITPELMDNPNACDMYKRTVHLDKSSAEFFGGQDKFTAFKDSAGYYIKVRSGGKYVKRRLVSCKVTNINGVCLYSFNAECVN